MDDIRHKLQAKPTRFLDQLRLHIRQQGLAYKTEQTYIHWVKRFIYFHNKQHPKNLGIKVSGTGALEFFQMDQAAPTHKVLTQCLSMSADNTQIEVIRILHKRIDVEINLKNP